MPFGCLFGTKLGGVLVWRKGSSLASFRGSGSSSSWSRRACVFLIFSKNSEGTLESFVVPFGRLFGTKLGGVLAFVVLPFWAGLG